MMQPKEYVIKQINHQETPLIPYTLPIEASVALDLDAYYGSGQWRERIMPYIFSLSAVDYHPLLEPINENHSRDGYGGIWRIDGNINHHVKAPVLDQLSEGFSLFSPEKAITPEHIQQLADGFDNHEASYRVVNLGAGIWEMFWHLRGFEDALMDVAADPGLFRELTDMAERQILTYIDLVSDLPVDAIMLGDDWGAQQGVLIGKERWRRFIKPGWARIIAAIHAKGKHAINHCCGSVAEIMPDIVEIGLDVLESVQADAAGMDPLVLKREFGDKITFWGGLGSQSIIPFGTPDELTRRIRLLCSEVGRGGGYILAPAKSLTKGTPVLNAVAILEAFTVQN